MTQSIKEYTSSSTSGCDWISIESNRKIKYEIYHLKKSSTTAWDTSVSFFKLKNNEWRQPDQRKICLSMSAHSLLGELV